MDVIFTHMVDEIEMARSRKSAFTFLAWVSSFACLSACPAHPLPHQSDLDSRLRRAQTLCEQHKPAEAAEELRSVLVSQPSCVAAYLQLGDAYRDMLQFSEGKSVPFKVREWMR